MGTLTLGDSASAVRTNLGLGTAATLNSGNAANNILTLDGSGNLPALSGSAITGISAGKVVQMVSDDSNTQVAFTNTSFADTEYSLNITPSSASNKIIVIWSCPVWNSSSSVAANARILQNGADMTGTCQLEQNGAQSATHFVMHFRQSPNTTSQITYKVQMYSQGGGTMYRSLDNGHGHLIAMEVSGV